MKRKRKKNVRSRKTGERGRTKGKGVRACQEGSDLSLERKLRNTHTEEDSVETGRKKGRENRGREKVKVVKRNSKEARNLFLPWSLGHREKCPASFIIKKHIELKLAEFFFPKR